MTKAMIKSFLVILVSALLGSPTFAAKPQNVISMSNGYPSGAHFNLIIHGKKTGNSEVAAEEVTTFNCPSGEGGNSVFVADYGHSTIQYISNKRASLTTLTVLDACAEAFDLNPAKVQLPYDEYWVFARLHGTPKNQDGKSSSVILTPEPVLQVCDYNESYTGDEPDDFATYTECKDSSLWVLGLVTTNGVYYPTPQIVESSDTSKKGKGPNKGAQEITGLFTWTGYVCNASLDVNVNADGTIGDGVIDVNDVPSDMNDDNSIDGADLTSFLLESCDYYENEWVFNVADLVVESMDFENKGGKTLHIRFYPRSTTSFESSVPPPTTPTQ